MAAFQYNARPPAPWLLLLVTCLPALAGCGMVAKGQNASGVKLYQQGAYDSAIGQFQTALRTDPYNADAYYNLASTYHQRGKQNNQAADLKQAEELYNRCIDNDPNHPDCYRALAVLLVETKQPDAAQRLLQGWAARSPALAAPRVELARLSEELGDKEKAQTYLQEAIAVDPYNARALTALGKLQEDLGNHAQALANYQRSLYTDKVQPEVAARISALQQAVGPGPLATPPATRTVQQPSALMK